MLYITNSGSNPEITCAPSCMSNVTTAYRAVPTATCVYAEDIGLCGLIAATNIHSIGGYSQWSCTTAGVTTTTPCSFPVWNGAICSGIDVVSINLDHAGLSGI